MVNKRSVAIMLGITLFFALLTGCSDQKNGAAPGNSAAPAQMPPAASQPAEWKSDGTISNNEYTRQQQIGDIEVYTRIQGDAVMMALKAKTKGYLALGIDPEEKMKGADILMCSVNEGKVSLVEMFSTGPIGPHPPKQGGTASVSMVSGSYQDGVMIVEFARKMNPGGPQDKPLKLGENKVIWAIGDNNNITQKHSQRGSGILVLQ